MEDRYISFSALELSGEDSFIAWVKLGENHEEWLDWQQAHPDRITIINEARYIVNMLSGQRITSMDENAKDQLWSSIKSDISSGDKTKYVQPRIRLMWWSLAAAVCLALLFWINTFSGNKNINVAVGNRAELTLPESSVVTVNAGSEINYNEKTFQRDREIRLDGEAFFKVKPGSKFTVITPQGNVTVVGTSFNVISRPGRFEVSCYTGKVKVDQGPKDKVEITSGQRCSAATMKDPLQLKPFDPSTPIPGWIAGKFTFENQPLSVVIDELERQYDVKVKLAPGTENIKYSGLFESGNLEHALSLITWPLHLNAQQSGKTIIISR